MTEPEDRDERIDALEADVAALRSRLSRAEQDAAAARILAGGADRDVGDLRGEFREFRDQNNRVLSAMRADVTDGFAEMRRGFRQVDDKFTEIRGLLDGQAAWNQKLADMLGVLIRQRRDDPTGRS